MLFRSEIWLWKPTIVVRRGRVWVEPNTYTPFLKNHDLPPGEVMRLKKAPKSFSFRGGVTHYDIFVDVVRDEQFDVSKRQGRWVPMAELKKSIPVSLIRKAIEFKGSEDAEI